MDEMKPKDPHPSQDLTPKNFATVKKKVEDVSLATKIQWTVLGVIGTATAGFVVWALATLGGINSAMAQDKATVEADHRMLSEHLDKDAAEKVVIFKMFEEQRKDSKAVYEAVMERKRAQRFEKDGGQ